jgi:hypothetical protein
MTSLSWQGSHAEECVQGHGWFSTAQDGHVTHKKKSTKKKVFGVPTQVAALYPAGFEAREMEANEVI